MAEIAYILGHSHATAFVAEDALAATAGQAIAAAGLDIAARAVIRLRGGEVPAGWADLQHWIDREGTPPQIDVGDHDLMRLMYTSGTESRPKVAMLSSRSLMWHYVSCVVDGGMAGDDVEAVVAVVVPKPGASLTEEAVITHTRGLLAGYKTPKCVVIVGAVPKTPAARSSNGNSATSTTTSPQTRDLRQPGQAHLAAARLPAGHRAPHHEHHLGHGHQRHLSSAQVGTGPLASVAPA